MITLHGNPLFSEKFRSFMVYFSNEITTCGKFGFLQSMSNIILNKAEAIVRML